MHIELDANLQDQNNVNELLHIQNVDETHLRSCQYQEECELLAKIAISPTEDVKLNHPSLVSKIKVFKKVF